MTSSKRTSELSLSAPPNRNPPTWVPQALSGSVIQNPKPFPQALSDSVTRNPNPFPPQLTTYVEELDEAGLIDMKEIVHLHDVVQMDLKKLRRAPLLIRPQRAMGLLRSTPLGNHVPDQFEQLVRRDAKERTYLKNAAIYKEGTVGQEVFVVGSGLVKVRGKPAVVTSCKDGVSSAFCVPRSGRT
jgi:hypothetical protein